MNLLHQVVDFVVHALEMSRSKKKGKVKYSEDDFEAFLKEVRCF